jgi:hypothetical protein
MPVSDDFFPSAETLAGEDVVQTARYEDAVEILITKMACGVEPPQIFTTTTDPRTAKGKC